METDAFDPLSVLSSDKSVDGKEVGLSAAECNLASAYVGAEVVAASSEVPGCEATNALYESPQLRASFGVWATARDLSYLELLLNALWRSEPGLPQWIALRLRPCGAPKLGLGDDLVRCVGWGCCKSSSSNPKRVIIHASRDGTRWRMVAELLSTTSARATPHLFELNPPLCVADEPFVRFSVTATAGGATTKSACSVNTIYFNTDYTSLPRSTDSGPPSSSDDITSDDSAAAVVNRSSMSIARTLAALRSSAARQRELFVDPAVSLDPARLEAPCSLQASEKEGRTMARPISPLNRSIESILAAEPSGNVKVVEDVQEKGVRTRTRAEQVHPLTVDLTIGAERDVDAEPGAATHSSNFVSIKSQVEDNERDSEPRCEVPVATLQPSRDKELPSTSLGTPRLIAEEQPRAVTTTISRALASVDALRLEIRSDATRARELGDQARANAESARKQARRAWLEAERAAVLRRDFVAQAAIGRKARATAVGKRERVKLRTAPKRAKPTKKTRTTSIQASLMPSAGSSMADDNGGVVAVQKRQDGVATKMDAATETGNSTSSATANASIQTDNKKCVFLVLPATTQQMVGVNRGQQTSPVRERQQSEVVEGDCQSNCETPERTEGALFNLSIKHENAVGDGGESESAQVQPMGMPVLKDAASQCEAVTPLMTMGDAATQSEATCFVSTARREKPREPYIPTVRSEDAELSYDLPPAQEADAKKPSFESAIFAHLITKKVREKRKKVKALLESTLRAKLRERNSKILELLQVSINTRA